MYPEYGRSVHGNASMGPSRVLKVDRQDLSFCRHVTPIPIYNSHRINDVATPGPFALLSPAGAKQRRHYRLRGARLSSPARVAPCPAHGRFPATRRQGVVGGRRAARVSLAFRLDYLPALSATGRGPLLAWGAEPTFAGAHVDGAGVSTGPGAGGWWLGEDASLPSARTTPQAGSGRGTKGYHACRNSAAAEEWWCRSSMENSSMAD